ncbi:MAG: NYN domain-containing protein [Kouleothrix sp.]|nr:NYN domain-containing protein [Kouleothrix sp.]
MRQTEIGIVARADVAMFIDWENMHGFIRGKANVSALREVAEGYGRLVLARAYADWREDRFQQDSLVLYKIGFEPIYVPSGFKNNVDVKLSTDCIDFAYRYPNINCFILVTGDGDFIHTVSALRPLGKQVIVIAQSNNASGRLGDLVDILLIYDRDVNPANNTAAPTAHSQAKQRPQSIDDVYREILAIMKDEKGSPMLLTHVKDKLIRMYGGFDQEKYGFEKFKDMMKDGETKGFFIVNTAGLRDWLTLPQIDTATVNEELPAELDSVFRDIVEIINASHQPQALLSYIKLMLVKKFGGFDESVYGYNQFKQMMAEGERLGYFRLGVNERQIDYAEMPRA